MIRTERSSLHYNSTTGYEEDSQTTSAVIRSKISSIYQVTPVNICIDQDTVSLTFSTYQLSLRAAEPEIDHSDSAKSLLRCPHNSLEIRGSHHPEQHKQVQHERPVESDSYGLPLAKLNASLIHGNTEKDLPVDNETVLSNFSTYQ